MTTSSRWLWRPAGKGVVRWLATRPGACAATGGNTTARTSPVRWITGVLIARAACGGDTTEPIVEPPDREPPPVPAEATAWIESNAVPFDGSHLSLPHDDIEFLRGLVGDARIVSLGENTHGTRDFFEMKARILRFVVEEMGFDAFVIEATWPEANRLDAYVRTGEGDPAELLSGLYFWTWNTESVLEMIEWIRSHNEAGGDVGFYGFDMQYPGMALHTVIEYLREVDAEGTDSVAAKLDCLARYANDPSGRTPDPDYRAQTADYRASCAVSLNEVHEHLTDRRGDYEAVAGEDAFALALQSMRVAIQYHLSINGEQSRDQSMAENTVWLQRRLGPEARLVLWAHNFHVSTQPGAQGWFLRQTYGDAMVVLGFTHEHGTFTGVRQSGSSYLGLDQMVLDGVRHLSYEHYLSSASAPRFFLDLRNRSLGAAGAAWLSNPRQFRTIGCCYDPGASARYWNEVPAAEWFDVLIHYETTRPTTVLPFRYPGSF